jgi:hypothetical protein
MHREIDTGPEATGMSEWKSLAEWWDAGTAPRAKDIMEDLTELAVRATDGTEQMEKWKIPGFDGQQTVEHSRQVVRMTGEEYERRQVELALEEDLLKKDLARELPSRVR